jgi:hypothetical protein
MRLLPRAARAACLALALSAASSSLRTHTVAAQAAPAVAADTTPRARPEDVRSVDAMVAAVYDVISGPAGQARDWNRFRSLFAPSARLIPTGKRPDGAGVIAPMTVNEYIARADRSLVADGFFERELGRKQERYGNIVHLMSAYDSRRKTDDPQPFARGVNSFQLWFDGARWWVVTIYWESETPGNPIPSEFIRR